MPPGTPDCVNGSFGYSAGPGFDLVTGLGSVNVTMLESAFQASTTTSLSGSATQVPVGSPVTLTATVRKLSGLIPQGSVNFEDTTADDNAAVILGYADLDATGVASAAFLLQLGNHSITAKYLDPLGSQFSSSNAGPLTIAVIPAPPPPPVLVSPDNNAVGASVSPQLGWSATAPNLSYDVYFGTTPSPPYWGHVAATPVWPGSLIPNTKYYWRVVAVNALGSSSSDVWSFTTNATVYTIGTIAGMSDSRGLSPNGTPAVNALFFNPIDVALDSKGDLYVADYVDGPGTGTGQVRMINTAGIVYTVAGGGSGGDGGPATAAQLANPIGIAVDSQGNLYISDSQYQGPSRIRKVSPNGIITIIAGGAKAGYNGDGGPAVSAQLYNPTGLAANSQGNLYIADTGNHCIREIAATIISTFAGLCGSPGSAGDGGPATQAALTSPTGVTIDRSGNVYIAENCQLREVANGIITTIAESGTPSGQYCPARLSVDSSGSVYSAQASGYVGKVANGIFTLIAGGGPVSPGDGGPGTGASLGNLGGLAVDSGGKVYFPEGASIRALSPSYMPLIPSIVTGGVRNGASFAPAPVAPGSIAAVFGSFGTGSAAQASGAPLPTTLSGLSIQFQSESSIGAPSFYASPQAGQINVQIPWELAGQATVPIGAMLNGTTGPSQSLKLAPFAPGIFSVGVQGSNQGAIVDSSNRLVDSTNPATTGSLIQIYCTGLGAVMNPPASGTAASSTTLSPTTTEPAVTIGGLQATILFSGLAPGSVGEYQVDAEVPAGVAPGSAVAVILSIGGVSSNAVTIGIK